MDVATLGQGFPNRNSPAISFGMQATTHVGVRDGVTFEDGVDRGRVLVSGQQTGGLYSLMEWIVAPSSDPDSYGAHRHNGIEETFLIRTGRLEFLLGDQVTSMGPGDFVRVPPGMRHGYANRSGQSVEMLVSFHPGGFEQLFVKYRTDAVAPLDGAGFVADATTDFGSEFEA